MDLTQLNSKGSGPNTGGGWSKVYIGFEKDIVSMPDRDAGNKAVISDNIVFKAGKGWNLLYCTKEKMKLTEKGSGKRDNDSVTSNFIAKRPGIDEPLRQFINEHGSDEMFLLIYKCGQDYPILLGRKCNPAFIDFEYDSGEGSEDDNDNTLTFASNGPFMSAVYKGAMDASKSTIAVDDATPDVSEGTEFITSANTVPTEITDLDNPIVGSYVTIYGGSDANPSSISDGANFSLTAAMSLGLGNFITLYIRGDDDYVEITRG